MYLSKYQFDSLRQFLEGKTFVLVCHLYGSYARGTAIAKSDIDLLLTIDYDQLEGKIEEYFALGPRLTILIGKHVSILTWGALSPNIQPFTNNDLVLIYDRNKDDIPYPEQFFSTFDKFSFRDKARLEHIRDALKLIQVWVNGKSEDGFINAPQLISACQKQLQLASELAKQLSPTTKDELESIHHGQSPHEELGLVNPQVQPYFGVDNKIIWQIVNFLVPGISLQIETFLNGWDDYYKRRLIQHFINFFESQSTPRDARLFSNPVNGPAIKTKSLWWSLTGIFTN